MDAVLIIILIVATLALLSRVFRTPPPQIIYVQTVTPEPVGGGLGCLLWAIAILVLLVVLGVIKL